MNIAVIIDEEKVLAIREKLSIVSQGSLDPEKYKGANEEESTDVYGFVQSKEKLSPSEVTVTADALG